MIVNETGSIFGGPGVDTMFGGLGASLFVYTNMNQTRVTNPTMDRILDFDAMEDVIDFSALSGILERAYWSLLGPPLNCARYRLDSIGWWIEPMGRRGC